jgi:hypothetical protein
MASSLNSATPQIIAPLNQHRSGKITGSNTMQAIQKEQDRLRILWEDKVANCIEANRYRNTVALLLSWEDSDFDHKELADELDDLETVFLEYGFEVKRQTVHSRQKPAQKLKKCFADLVHDYDHPNTLLIIYYAGHGWSAEAAENEAHDYALSGKTGENASMDPKNFIAWRSAEENLVSAEDAELFIIFDSCDAGSLSRYRGAPKFEFLGACAAGAVTLPPGKNSFTRALIWAFQKLRRKSPPAFTTPELQNTITEAPMWRKSQWPPLNQRRWSTLPYIVISAKEDEPNGSRPPIDSEIEPPPPPPKYEYLDIRLHFISKLEDEPFVKTADAIRKLIQSGEIEAKRATFLEKHGNGVQSIYRNRWHHAFDQLKRNPNVQRPLTPKSGPVSEAPYASDNELNNPTTDTPALSQQSSSPLAGSMSKRPSDSQHSSPRKRPNTTRDSPRRSPRTQKGN